MLGAFGLSVVKLQPGLSQRSIRNKKLHHYPKGRSLIFDWERGGGGNFVDHMLFRKNETEKSLYQLTIIKIISNKLNQYRGGNIKIDCHCEGDHKNMTEPHVGIR